jgi:hypothetical protein
MLNTNVQSVGYQSDELKLFHRVLRELHSELCARASEVKIADVAEKLFDFASKGERDPEKLKLAILDWIGLPQQSSKRAAKLAVMLAAQQPG